MHAFTVGWARKRAVGIALAAGVAGSITACSPALDWREVRLEGPGLQALFPCRPVAQSRQVELAGAPVTMSLHACEAAGATYAVSVVDVQDPARIGSALQALHEGSVAKVRSATPATSAALGVDGMTPQAAAGRWRLSGQRPDGSPLVMETAVFARGTWVLQASVIGTAPSSIALTPFFEGLRFSP